MSTPSASEVAGFRFAGVTCGLKKSGSPDVALLVSDRPATAAGVFTRSTVVGAPVTVCREHLRSARTRAIAVNSGIANVAMGEAGVAASRAMAEAAGRAVGCAPREVLVASTGVIGLPLPLPRIRRGLREAAAGLDAAGLPAAARAIMTTDTVPKLAARSLRLGGRTVRVAGIAKGSGMIEPRMATMLAFLATDAEVARGVLRPLWREVCDATFNRVSVDGETSTSDTALLLANGASGAPAIRGPRSPGLRALREALLGVAGELARALARDGEGATKLVTVEVSGARSGAQAERAARRIANSMLVKTALFGRDPNWGRILQTVGAGEVGVALDRCEVRLCGVAVYRRGASAGPAARARAGRRLEAPEVTIQVDLGVGRGTARLWTCDLSYDYVRINAEYTT